MNTDNNLGDKENPFKEWDEIFISYSALLRKRQAEKYMNASNKFKKFLTNDGRKIGYNNSEKFLVKRFLVKETSLFFRQFLLDENASGRLTIESCSQILSRVNKILLFAEKNGLTSDVNILQSEIHYTAEGNNRGHESFSDAEVEQIRNVLKQELVFIDYVIQNPSYIRTIDVKKHDEKNVREAVTLFEDPDCLNGCPIPATNKNQALSKKHQRFFRLACFGPGGLAGFYRKIGVMDMVDARVVGSLLLKLAIETGYNPCSLYSLKIDCLVERSLPFGNPSIEFEKNRSGGFNTMPIILFDNDPVRMDLKKKQFQIIKKTINSIVAITSRIRERAPDELKPYLFIYESRSGHTFNEVIRFSDPGSQRFCQQLVKTYGLKNDNGEPLKLRLVRFRSTRLTQMIKDGIDIFEVQAAAVHGNVRTTINYIHTHRIEPQLDAEVRIAVERIHTSFATTNGSSSAEVSQSNKNPQVFSGVISNCKNPYDPPAEIRGIQNYKKGKACTYFNMCLSCPNIIITNFHLPLLINYRNQISNSEVVKNNEGPHPHIYKKSLAILDSLLNEESSPFTKVELDLAKRKAELHVDKLIDPLFHIPSKLKLDERKTTKIS